MTDVPTIVYELALRSLDQQERELAELRSRTNTVIAAAALIGSFLGAAAIRERSGLDVLGVLALVVLVITGGLSLYVLWPRELRFAIDARATYEDHYPLLDDPAEAQLRVAYGARDRYTRRTQLIAAPANLHARPRRAHPRQRRSDLGASASPSRDHGVHLEPCITRRYDCRQAVESGVRHAAPDAMRGGLMFRAFLAAVLLAVLVAGAFAALLVAVEDLKASARKEALSETRLDAADHLDLLVTQMQSGLRGVVITKGRSPQVIQQFTAADATFPAQMAALERRETDPRQVARLETIHREVSSYAARALATIRAAEAGTLPPNGPARHIQQRNPVIHGILGQFDAYRSTQLALRNQLARRDDALTRRAVISAVVGLVGSLLLVLLFYGYLSRVLVSPVRRVAQAARRLAAGDLAFRVPESGTGETLVLEQSFNSMAVSLEQRRDELGSLVDEQSALRRVATVVARGSPPAEVFARVAEQMGLLLGADAAAVWRYEQDRHAILVGRWGQLGETIPIGGRFSLEGDSLTSLVYRTGRPARVEAYEDVPGQLAAHAREFGARFACGAPIFVSGRLWGSLTVVAAVLPLGLA